MGHGRVLVAVLAVSLAFPALAWGDAQVSLSGQIYTYEDTTGADDNVTVRAGETVDQQPG